MTFALIPQPPYCVNKEDTLRLIILTLPLFLPPSAIPILKTVFPFSQNHPSPISETTHQLGKQASKPSIVWMYFFMWKKV